MAGSYQHIVTDKNEFRGVELLDHLGDSYEALEECYYMTFYLSGGDKKKIFEVWLEGYVKEAIPEHYEEVKKQFLERSDAWWT